MFTTVEQKELSGCGQHLKLVCKAYFALQTSLRKVLFLFYAWFIVCKLSKLDLDCEGGKLICFLVNSP